VWNPVIHSFEGRRQQTFSKHIMVSPSWGYSSPALVLMLTVLSTLEVFSSAVHHTQCDVTVEMDRTTVTVLIFHICLLKFFANCSTCCVIFWLKSSHSKKKMFEL
jgi:hypothetical protein